MGIVLYIKNNHLTGLIYLIMADILPRFYTNDLRPCTRAHKHEIPAYFRLFPRKEDIASPSIVLPCDPAPVDVNARYMAGMEAHQTKMDVGVIPAGKFVMVQILASRLVVHEGCWDAGYPLRYYLIQWCGYSIHEATWEPECNVPASAIENYVSMGLVRSYICSQALLLFQDKTIKHV